VTSLTPENTGPQFARFPPVLPFDCPTDLEAAADFYGLQQCYPRVTLRPWHSRSQGIEMPHSFCLPDGSVGAVSSNRYHYGARMACDSLNSASVVRNWYDAKLRVGLEASKFYADSPRTAMTLRKYVPSQFKPLAAKAIYDIFKADTIYDPCMGWGDRLAAAMSLPRAVSFYGRDVNPFVFAGYSEQVKAFGGQSDFFFEFRGAETQMDFENVFDVSFTSPPYYKAEKYAGTGQSHSLYKTFPVWLEKFLFPMADNCLKAVRHGGYVVFNISDVYADHRVNVICAPLIAHLRTAGAEYLGAIGYPMGRRVNRNAADHPDGSQFAEPVLVFRKGAGPALLDILMEYACDGL